MIDYVIHDTMVVDGTGREGYRADIGIGNGKIVSIGNVQGERHRTIGGTGLVASPGFIDMHTHSDLELFKAQPPYAKVRQGVTTELLGQDGLGTTPVKESDIKVLIKLLSGLNGFIPREKWIWRSLGDYLEALGKQSLPNNVAVLISHGPVRMNVMGMEERDANDRELGAMKRLVREAMEEGAFGLSTGLIYPPCSYGNTRELIELNQEVAVEDGIFVVHLRDEGYYLSTSFDEVIQISKESGVHLHISHLQAYGKVNWPTMDEVLRRPIPLSKMVERSPGIATPTWQVQLF